MALLLLQRLLAVPQDVMALHLQLVSPLRREHPLMAQLVLPRPAWMVLLSQLLLPPLLQVLQDLLELLLPLAPLALLAQEGLLPAAQRVLILGCVALV